MVLNLTLSNRLCSLAAPAIVQCLKKGCVEIWRISNLAYERDWIENEKVFVLCCWRYFEPLQFFFVMEWKSFFRRFYSSPLLPIFYEILNFPDRFFLYCTVQLCDPQFWSNANKPLHYTTKDSEWNVTSCGTMLVGADDPTLLMRKKWNIHHKTIVERWFNIHARMMLQLHLSITIALLISCSRGFEYNPTLAAALHSAQVTRSTKLRTTSSAPIPRVDRGVPSLPRIKDQLAQPFPLF